MDKIDFLVSVRCLTYNHAAYIRDTMDGFCMQQTYFPFVCVILDDASTDGEQEVIKNYLALHFEESGEGQIEETEDYVLFLVRHKDNTNCYFAVYFLKTNHFGKKAKAPYLERWEKRAKYVAYCEGDDYWIDKDKIRKQVEYLDNHLDCSMTISNGMGLYLLDYKKKVLNPIPVLESKKLSTTEVLRERGGLIPTASMCLRSYLIFNEPEPLRKAPVGDRPIRMWCALNGYIYYDVVPMVVYRISSVGSFTERVRNRQYAKNILDGMISVFVFFDKYTDGRFHEDVQYMKDREEYYYYYRINDYFSLTKCDYYKSLSIKRRIKIMCEHYLNLISPNLYKHIRIIKHMFVS